MRVNLAEGTKKQQKPIRFLLPVHFQIQFSRLLPDPKLTINNPDILNRFRITAHRLDDVISVLVPANAVLELNIAEGRNVFRICTLNNRIIPADCVENVVHCHGEAFLLDADHEDIL